MSETFLGSANIIETGIRTVFSMLDRPAYWLLEMVYQLFFNVASADIFANGMVMKFYGRIQMILSVFMMFQLALIILKGIMNPDSFYDKKAGVGSFVTRVVVALVLLVLMVPIKTGGQNEFDDQIASNGLLFGTLYSLQHRILANNTIGKLVMGSSATDYMSDSSDAEDLKKASRIFTSTVLRGFYRINLLPEDDRPRHEDGKDDAVFNDNRVCQDIDDKVLDSYTKLDADPGDIIGLINETCEPNLSLNVPVLSSTSGSKKYAFTFMPVISTIVGFIFAFILLSFTVDIAVRAVKLAVLRLIAPIPIISYMNPKGSTDTAFNSWVKTLTSTYLDLFIRLAAVYFVIAIIQEMIAHGIYINHGNGLIGILSLILIWIGLFVFAKQAPKFIKNDVLGLKGEPGKLFGGFGELMGATALIGGTVGSAVSGITASRLSAQAREQNANSPLNIGRQILSGFAGGVSGVATGMAAWQGAKDHQGRAVSEAIQKRNAANIAKGSEGSTFLGRMGSSMRQYFTGDGSATKIDRQIANEEGRQKAVDAIAKRVSGEMVKQDWTYGDASGISGLHGIINGSINYKDFMSRYRAASASGATDFEIVYKDQNGVMKTDRVTTQQAEYYQGMILASNEDDYIRQVTSGNQSDSELMSLIHDAELKGGSGLDSNGNFDVNNHNKITSRKDYKSTSEGLGQDIRNKRRQNVINKANDRFSGKNSS